MLINTLTTLFMCVNSILVPISHKSQLHYLYHELKCDREELWFLLKQEGVIYDSPYTKQILNLHDCPKDSETNKHCDVEDHQIANLTINKEGSINLTYTDQGTISNILVASLTIYKQSYYRIRTISTITNIYNFPITNQIGIFIPFSMFLDLVVVPSPKFLEEVRYYANYIELKTFKCGKKFFLLPLLDSVEYVYLTQRNQDLSNFIVYKLQKNIDHEVDHELNQQFDYLYNVIMQQDLLDLQTQKGLINDIFQNNTAKWSIVGSYDFQDDRELIKYFAIKD